MIDFPFILNSLLLGLGLTMDAFSVSLVAGMNEPNISKGKTTLVAGTFSVFPHNRLMRPRSDKDPENEDYHI